MSVDVSCSDGVSGRWRTELDLRGGKPFDDTHRATTLGARPSIAGRGRGYLWLGLCRAEQLKAKWQGGSTSAIGQQAEVTDAHDCGGSLGGRGRDHLLTPTDALFAINIPLLLG